MSDAGHVLVTGASRGLGAAFARSFARDGHRVSLLARNTTSLETLAAEIRQAGGAAHYLTCDVTVATSVKSAIDRAVAGFGPINILINNAGVVEPIERIRDTEPHLWRMHIEVNLLGPFHVLHFATKNLARRSVVVNVSSGAAYEPAVGRSAYCAGKAGLNVLSRVFALEEADQLEARVFSFTPGPTQTDMQAQIRNARINRQPSFKAPPARPVEDAVAFLRWLCTDAASDLAGQFVDARDPEMRRRAGLH